MIINYVHVTSSSWQITTLNLDSQHISKISNVDRLENLKFASFNDNDITKIEVTYCRRRPLFAHAR